MTDVYFIIALIVITDGIIICCKYIFDKPCALDTELKPDIIIGFNFWDSLFLPLIFVFLFAWLLAFTQDNAALKLLLYVIVTVFVAISTYALIKIRFKRFYLTDKGIVILDLLTKKYSSISTDAIEGYSYRTGRGGDSYLVATTNKNILFSTRQIRNIQQFKAYFAKHQVQYYEYDSMTGNDYPKK